MISREWIVFWVTTQVATFVVLVLVLGHYRVVQKAWQEMTVSK